MKKVNTQRRNTSTKPQTLPAHLFGATNYTTNIKTQAYGFVSDDEHHKITFQTIANRNKAFFESIGLTSKDLHDLIRLYILDGRKDKMTNFAKFTSLFVRKGRKTQNIGVKESKYAPFMRLIIALHARHSDNINAKKEAAKQELHEMNLMIQQSVDFGLI